jgi:hypothetical protein
MQLSRVARASNSFAQHRQHAHGQASVLINCAPLRIIKAKHYFQSGSSGAEYVMGTLCAGE